MRSLSWDEASLSARSLCKQISKMRSRIAPGVYKSICMRGLNTGEATWKINESTKQSKAKQNKQTKISLQFGKNEINKRRKKETWWVNKYAQAHNAHEREQTENMQWKVTWKRQRTIRSDQNEQIESSKKTTTVELVGWSGYKSSHIAALAWTNLWATK